MTVILCIESSTTLCSVALAKDGEPVDFEEVNDGYTHAEKLAPFADEILKRNSIQTGDLNAIAVSKGPGSYTGLRIGVSLAKGLAYATKKPLIAIDTLQQMCLNPKVKEELWKLKAPLFCPMLDARRMEVFAAVYDIDLKEKRAAAPMILDEQSFEEELNANTVLFFGNGSDKFKKIQSNPNAGFVDDVWPTSMQMAQLAEQSFQQNDFVDLAYFEPNYLKAFQATTPKK